MKEVGVEGQEKLKKASLLCVGLGGLGSSLLQYLTAAGVGRIGIVDGDVVELSNLHRQVLYKSSQTALAKTVCALEHMQALNPQIQVEAYSERLTKNNANQLIHQYDMVADCTDNFYTNYLIHDVCFQQRKPYAYASISQFQGYCTLFNSKQGPCLRCLFPNPPDPASRASCDAGGVLGVLPGLLGTIQASEILKWFLGIGHSLEKRLLMVDLLKMSFKEIELTLNPDCLLCGHQLPLDELVYPATCQSVTHYSITWSHLFALLNERKVVLIDVRSYAEHIAYNIGGKGVPLPELTHRLHEFNKSQEIVLYCQTGTRSIEALKLLLQAGFSSVKYLIGGINAGIPPAQK